MRTYPLPKSFSGKKFAQRYGLNALRGDFWTDGVVLYVPDTLADDPPVFEAPDPSVSKGARIDAVSNLNDLKQLLKEIL